jgi:hypothetical protein
MRSLVFVLCLSSAVARAAQPPPCEKDKKVAVIAVETRARNQDGTTAQSTAVGLDDEVVVTLCGGGLAQLRGGDPQKPLFLYVGGEKITAARPDGEGRDDSLRFILTRDGDNRAAWGRLLGGRIATSRAVAITVGADDASLAMSTSRIQLSPLRDRAKAELLIAFGLLLLVVSIYLALATATLRDPGTGTTDRKASLSRWREFGTFSLSRCQMAFWFCMVGVAFVLIWAVTGATDTITTSALTLMGIGAGTALGARLVDDTKLQQLRNRKAELEALTVRSAPEESELDAIKKQVDAARKGSQGPLVDLFTDENGYSLHRMQLLVWTAVLAVIFWSSVWNRLSMPDFDATMLALMGISSGTYLGFKFPESQPAVAKPSA